MGKYGVPPQGHGQRWVRFCAGSVLTYCRDTERVNGLGRMWGGKSGLGGTPLCLNSRASHARCPCPLTGASLAKGGSYYRQARGTSPVMPPGESLRMAPMPPYRGFRAWRCSRSWGVALVLVVDFPVIWKKAGCQSERCNPANVPQERPGGSRRWSTPRRQVEVISELAVGKDHQREGGSAGFWKEGI